MENPTVTELRSRSRSKTPFLRSSCDGENCTETGEDHVHHKSGRKTHRSTPTKQLHRHTPEPLIEVDEEPAHRTRQAARMTSEKLVKTSDYSSEESLDRLRGVRKDLEQNFNSVYEECRVSTSTQRYKTLADLPFGSIRSPYHVNKDWSGSVCSTDSTFAEQALADASLLLERDPSPEHLPYKLYKMAGEYWNKYPKTDYTYSYLSKDRVELSPGQVAVPNMSRRSLSAFRVHGPNVSADELDELDRLAADMSWTSNATRKRSTYSSERADQRWWITRLLMTIITTITTTTSSAYRSVVGPSHRYPYTDRRPSQAGVVSRTASAVAAPFYWIYSVIKTMVTTTVTTVTETVTPNHVSKSESYEARSYHQTAAKRRWWPWLLLLLLPVLGYGCYNYGDQFVSQEPLIEAYKSPQITQDPDLSKRMAALETWALNVDSKLRNLDQKILTQDKFEAQIKEYSFKHLQQNLIHIFNAENSEALAAKLKAYFDKQYLTKEQMVVISQEFNEKLNKESEKTKDEKKIRQWIEEYLAVFKSQQMEFIMETVRYYVKEREVRVGGFDEEAVRKIVAGMLNVYDADKTGVVDYALESAGGQVISTKCTELYQIKTKQYTILGLPVWWVYTSPRHALTPGALPAECWAFQGFPGYLVVRTYAIIEVTGFSLEHMSRLLAVDGKIESAPKNFSVYGLHGEMDPEPHLFGDYTYDANGTAIQHFPVKYPKTSNIGGVEYPVAYDMIELRVESNHGNPTYTCVYRFRVHGNPLTDIRKATEDSIRDSET